MRPHCPRVAMHDVLRQHVGTDTVQIVCFFQLEILGEYFEQIRSAFGDIVRQQLNSVYAHQSKKGVVSLFKLRLPKLDFDGSKLPLQNAY